MLDRVASASTAPSAASPGAEADEGYVDLFGRRFYRIGGYDRMEPFFMTVLSAADPWLFVSSTGGVTAGRVQPDVALFPYYTDDKVAEGAGRTGGLSLLRVRSGEETVVWEPFTAGPWMGDPAVRALYKDVLGTSLVFEETRPDLGLRMRVTWESCGRYGIVRTSELANLGDAQCSVELLDGFVNLLPAGVEVTPQNRLSNLLDAYKRTELDPASGLGLYWLSSRLTDLAEPSEALVANVAWQVGLADVDHLLTTRQVRDFRLGGDVHAEQDVRGERGAYLVHATLSLAPGEERTWRVVGDVAQDAADVVDLRDLLLRPAEVGDLLEADLRANRAELERIVASADGLQRTGDELATAHHFANVVFNVMRGGIPVDGYHIEAADFRAFLAERSPQTAQQLAVLWGHMPEQLTIEDLLRGAAATGDPDLQRLALEYLPLTFSRRHGDPSRPWNTFQIVLRDEHGAPRLSFQGNWRDIFQNWEALAWSYPEYLESMVTVFLDATTADGYNPYRISRSGIDWEVPEPDNPWANIGYWSDHQIIYLLRLLETSARFHPARLGALLDQALFTHADVPYRIDTYDEILRDPFDTITFDEGQAERVAARVEVRGADGRLVVGPDGEVLRVTMAEKLLLLMLAKIVNLVPDGGIWMNTQRPEWNDANNALVGRGLSVVTLAQLRRYLDFVDELVTDDVHVTEELAGLATAVAGALADHAGDLEAGFTDRTRRAFMDELGQIGSAYREQVYAGFSGRTVVLPAGQVRELLGAARSYVGASLQANARPDSLYHSYNVLDLGEGTAGIRRLSEMLEGQVAVLSSDQLGAAEALSLLASLRASALFRADQHSYVLYPDKDLAGFMSRNRFTADRALACPLVPALVESGDRSLVVRDVNGDLHFAAGIRNARDVEAVLDGLAGDPGFAGLVAGSRAELLAIFEEVFTHAEFTGRSGSFFAYEGLGSIYWHMVSKLLLAVQEVLERAVAEGEPAETVAALEAAYEDIRAGLGYCKPATVYGAFPTDPYSHTPAGHGARQPGMTGQVKEEVLTRLGELGLRVERGQIVLRPLQLRASEWLPEPLSFEYLDVAGAPRVLDLPAGSLAFTFCQVPVMLVRSDRLEVRVHLADGTSVDCPDGVVPAELSASVFARDGRVVRIEGRVQVGVGAEA
jgi:hypothetical protein